MIAAARVDSARRRSTTFASRGARTAVFFAPGFDSLDPNSRKKMSTQLQPYLFFAGRCEEALEFYRAALGAKVEMVMRFDQSPDPVPPGMLEAGFENKIMHSSFQVAGNTIMASDGCDSKSKFDGFSLALTVPTEAEADKAFDALAEGGKVTMPLSKTFWSPRYGMVTDKFGIGWMVMVPGAAPC
jgi:PhnB protein